MLIPAAIRVLARALEPLVADEVWDHPMIVDKIGMEVWAIRAVFAVLALMISGTDRRPEFSIGNDLVIHDFLVHRQHRPRDDSVEGFDRTTTQESIPRIGTVCHGVFEESRGEEKISAEILYQNGHGHEHVRVDRQLQILECRSV